MNLADILKEGMIGKEIKTTIITYDINTEYEETKYSLVNNYTYGIPNHMSITEEFLPILDVKLPNIESSSISELLSFTFTLEHKGNMVTMHCGIMNEFEVK